jgi:hypothetical protein
MTAHLEQCEEGARMLGWNVIAFGQLAGDDRIAGVQRRGRAADGCPGFSRTVETVVDDSTEPPWNCTS